jgi:polar amino acid transport system permease protein
VLPQAIRIAVPPLINQTLLLFKNTSLAMAIGVGELTYRTREVESYTFKTFEAFAVATAIYLAISFGIMACGAYAGRRLKLETA